MTNLTKVSFLGGVVILAGCGLSTKPGADTAVSASSSSTTSVTAAPVDTTPGPAVTTTTSGSKPSAGGSTTTKTTVTTTKKSSEAVPDPTIIGHDRVLRFPRRSLPPASSTPQR